MFNEEQANAAADVVDRGANVLVMGPAGTGKSRWVSELARSLEKNVMITSMTGAALAAIPPTPGVKRATLHSGLGVGLARNPPRLAAVRVNKDSRERIEKLDVLFVDEISMMSSALFEWIDTFLRRVRRQDELWGGIQLVFVGDILQLPPVGSQLRPFYQSDLFAGAFCRHTFVHNFRQGNFLAFADLLKRIGRGEQTEADHALLRERLVKADTVIPPNALHVFGQNKPARRRNARCFSRLDTDIHTYTAKARLQRKGEDPMDLEAGSGAYNSALKLRDTPAAVELREGARVMLLRNINTDAGLYNGAMGTIDQITPEGVEVDFDGGYTSIITMCTDENELNEHVSVSVWHMPLRLAYAVTIHKSQGMTCDAIVLNLDGDSCFLPGMAYVALSRVRSLDHIFLHTFSPDCIRASQDHVDFMYS